MRYPAEAVDKQMERLKQLFRDEYVYLTVDMEKRPDNIIKYTFRAGAEYPHPQPPSFVHGQPSFTAKCAVDNLLKEMKITTVQQYILINHTYRCEECGETYHHPFSVTEISSESSYTILNACDNCQMQVIHEICEQEDLMAEQGLEGGTK